jgi:predicted kinase
MTPEERAMRTQMDVFLVTMEARIRTLDERKSALEAELDAQLRGLSRLEAMLEDWMKQQP